MSAADVIYSLAILAIITFMLRVKDLIGGEAFLSLLNGRYHKPVSEERIFLFIDVVGSTQFAERFGDLRAQEYLGRFFAALAGPVRKHRGEIDDYVGDLAIITWPLRRGRRGGALPALRLRDPRRDRAGGAAPGRPISDASRAFARRCMAGPWSRPRSASTVTRSPISATR